MHPPPTIALLSDLSNTPTLIIHSNKATTFNTQHHHSKHISLTSFLNTNKSQQNIHEL